MNPETDATGEPSAWDNQKRLTGELGELVENRANANDINAKADEINRNVAGLVDAGELDPDMAWALSAGANPYLQDGDTHPDM